MCMNKKDRIELLTHKFQNGSIDKQEFAELLDWYNSFDDSQVELSGSEDITLSTIKNRMYDHICSQVDIAPKPLTLQPRSNFNLWKWSASIAAIFVCIVGLWWAFKSTNRLEDSHLSTASSSILPGSNKATLKLADGSTIILDQQAGGLISDEQIHYADGTSVLNQGNKLDENSRLILETPRGGTYQITLEDGTNVWLNAGSKLIYPARFVAAEKRIVEIQGEAYFKVEKKLDKHGHKIPFIVKANRQEIEVLGTEFNVADYAHLEYSHTTLIEGSVSVSHAGKASNLKPNQQWLLQKNHSQVKVIKTAPIVAWKDNKFNFEDKPLDEVLDEIALWYDIKIVYLAKVPQVELMGDAYRNSDFNLILRLLEVAKVSYKLDKAQRILYIN
ncbi:FecR family protein [Sphingobacterium bovistauri]|uniref:FecR domain-containing protein n=1 Tax=Sphingobacterium bovistauri TaxID=2781959 RepID=A0ABS7ZA15_9SPHI|nr:FecR family protein [Sphingobacterium bovistauri]MCA5005549.1 FecR domain-containing protein [Sphingobacterium bovistauri]